MEKVRKKSIFELKLDEGIKTDSGRWVQRVPGGWLYDSWDYDRNRAQPGVFVPYSNEFMDQDLQKVKNEHYPSDGITDVA